MTKGHLQIHSENILPIIKHWLYSDRDIFVRELVANACDALYKVKILRDQGMVSAVDADFRIDIAVDKENKTITISDTGIGMDAAEIERYIANVAFSSAEEFVEKYQKKSDGEQIIGHFGLGFYSAYMAAGRVEIQSKSYKADAEPVWWSCDGSAEYELGEGTRQERGTDIILHVSEDQEEFLDVSRIRGILDHHCRFLSYPIFLNDEQVNTKEPLWVKPATECTDQDYLDFYKVLYPFEAEPLFWVHLNVDYPFNLKGILYFPKMHRDLKVKEDSIHLYCNRVFVTDDCHDIVPDYLLLLRGVIDSSDIPLNVSRSTMQVDKTVRQVAQHISKKVSDRLSALHRHEKERFVKCWEDIAPVIKVGALQDEKFYERVREILLWKNTDSEWVTVAEYLERNGDKVKDKVYYTTDAAHQPQCLRLYREKGIEVLQAGGWVDLPLINFLEGKLGAVKFCRIDGALDDALLDESREKTVLDAEGKTDSSRLAQFVKQQLADADVEVEAKSLSSDALPGVVVLDESSRRLRDYMSMHYKDQGMSMPAKRTFVVNTNNPLMEQVHQMAASHPELAKELVQEVFELSLLAQKELPQEGVNLLVERSLKVLAALAEKVKS